MRRVIVGVFLLLALALSAVSVAAQQPAPQAQPSAMVQVFVNKGYLTPDEAASILQGAASQAEANQRMLKVFLAKGMLTQQEYDTASGAAVATETGSGSSGAHFLTASTAASPTVQPSGTSPVTPDPPAKMAEWPVSAMNAGYDPSDGTSADASVIPAIAPVRVLPITLPRDPKGIIPDIKLGSGAMMNVYGYLKATAIYDTTNSGGGTVGSDDFPLPLLLNTGNGDTGPDSGSQFRIKVRSSRIGANFFVPISGPDITVTGRLEADFEGDYTTVGNRNVSSIRSSQFSLRLAWARIDGKVGGVPYFFLFGQDWTPLASSTQWDLVETTQNGAFFGNTYERVPQFRTGLQFSAGKLKIQPEFAITLSGFGDNNINNSASSSLFGSLGAIPTGFQNQNREGAVLGQASGQPGVQGRLVFDFPLNSGWKGVPNAEIVFSGGHAEAEYIVPVGQIPTTAVPSLTVATGATPAGLSATACTTVTAAGFSIRCYYPTGLTNNVPQNMWTSEISLPTPWFTLVSKYYRGADMRFMFGGQLNSAFRDDNVGVSGAAVAPLTIPAALLIATCPTTACTTFSTTSVPQTVYALSGDPVTFSAVGGSAVEDPYRPIRGQGGFIQLGVPLSRIFGANPDGLNSGWLFYMGYGIDSAFARDVIRANGNGLSRSDYAPVSLRYRMNKWMQFVEELTWYDTRTADAERVLYRGIDSHVNHDIRQEFGTIFTF